MYQALKPSRSTFVPIRHLDYHVLEWGTRREGESPLVLMHGWMDVSASWQFMVDALQRDRWIIAADWRGFGLTRNAAQAPDNYWFPDYFADLDGLLDHFSPGAPVDLVGHSMGANVVMFYAGIRPDRVQKLVNLEGFGLPQTRPAQAPERYGKWLDEIKLLHEGKMSLRAYDSLDGVARRLQKTNPRLAEDKARWLAQHWAARNDEGQWEILGDPAHKVVSAHLYQVEESLAVFRRITAPTLAVTASDDSLSSWWRGNYRMPEFLERMKAVPDLRHGQISDAGHMLHHDQPGALASMIEDFLYS
ncbi:alpha/beta hydrolase [Hydrogenophaga sp. 5NK40-0174]|uniref:alpha/beta fold hydrolase n=1 Tax=Hydrogenophaga sp. 5NK40-0174 TaxID=3127649 RepID=UPI00310B4385